MYHVTDFLADVWADLIRDFHDSHIGRLYRWLRPKGRHRG